MDFPIAQLMDEDACCTKILGVLHPQGLKCPRCACEDFGVHRRHRAPVLDYRCKSCGRVFNAFTGPPFDGRPKRPSQIMQILRGFAQCVSTAQLARELGLERTGLLELRHLLPEYAAQAIDRKPLPDAVTEADEAYQNAGEKGVPHRDPDDPPRRRANKVRGQGTWAVDRPPVFGAFGRDAGRIRLEVGRNSDDRSLMDFVAASTRGDVVLNSHEWRGYKGVAKRGCGQSTCYHAPGRREWARNDDGDGVREVHCNSMEDVWTWLRKFLRAFRGVSKLWLPQYVAMFEWSNNLKTATDDFLRALLGVQTDSTVWNTWAQCLSGSDSKSRMSQNAEKK